MKIISAKSYQDLSRKAANIISAQVILKPNCVLGLATGSTPIGLYADLVEDFQADRISFEQVTTFNLDEYRGLSPEHDQSYRYFMQKNLFDHVDIDPEATSVPDGANPDAQAACESYEQAISEACGIDLQLLGLGHNGHIGFNEPCDEFPVRTHVVELTESTINANSRLFESIDQVPREAYTMGIGSIMKARKILVVVSGEDKADALKATICGPITPQVPASILQLHNDVTIVADEAALSKMDI